MLAALHDVQEEEPGIDLEGLFRDGGNGMWIANSVEVLTRDPSETYSQYIESILDGHSSTWVAEIREVKLADLRDNLGRIPTPEEYNQKMHDELAHVVSCWPDWEEEWGSLKRRYEKAIATLEAGS